MHQVYTSDTSTGAPGVSTTVWLSDVSQFEVETVQRRSEPSELRTLVIIPTYNERENLPLLVAAILAIDPRIEILVVDDASPDGTGELAETLAVETGRVSVIHREGKLGLGTAYLTGFAWALGQGYDRIVQMDADFSHRPGDLPRLLAASAQADLVIGSRNVAGGRITGWSPLRHFLSKGGSLYARLLLGLPVRDCTAGFKCFRREALAALDLPTIRANGYAFQIEVNHACACAGLHIVEVPVEFPDRTRGQSKMCGAIALEACLLVLRLRSRRKRLVRTPAVIPTQ